MQTSLRIMLFLFLAFGLFNNNAAAQTEYLYTSNNTFSPNTVSAFAINSDGTLTNIAGSPYSTDGIGSAGMAGQASVLISREFLYASNNGSTSVSGFSINPDTGSLTPISGSPFGVEGGFSNNGISLAATPDGRFIIAGNANPGVITVFRVAENGSLTPITGSPFAMPFNTQMCAMKVTPNGKFLIVSMLNGVAIYNIAETGALSQVRRSPFLPIDGSFTMSLNCASSRLFVSTQSFDFSEVDVFKIEKNGSITRINGSPFSVGPRGPNNLLLSNNGRFLFSGNPINAITVATITPAGALQIVNGSPFPVNFDDFNQGTEMMAVNRDGSLLFSAMHPNRIAVLRVSETGIVTNVPGSPFAPPGVSLNATLSTVAVYPAHVCRPKILNITRAGKNLVISGEAFEAGSLILLNGKKQKTKADAANPEGLLIGTKTAKQIKPGDTVNIQVRWPNGTLSENFPFTLP